MGKNNNVISQGDYGVVISINLLDENNSPVAIQSDTINVYIICPNETEIKVDPANITITDNINGVIRINLIADYTMQVGNYNLYAELVGSTYKLNSTAPTSYYVSSRHGLGGNN